MKSLLLALTGMVLTGSVWAADVAPPATPAPPATADWIATFQRYAAQQSVAPDEAEDQQQVAVIRTRDTLDEVLRALPAPPDWAKLQQAVAEAAKQVSADQKLERERLQAAGWLLGYLTGNRAAVQAEVAAALAAAESRENDPRVEALREMNESLGTPAARGGPTVEKLVQSFEEELVLLEPLDDATVKQAVGGEENFARLNRLIGQIRELQGKTGEVLQEYRTTKDKPAAQAKMAELEKEFEEKFKPDESVLKPYLEIPVVQRYLNKVLLDETLYAGHTQTLTVPDLMAVMGRERAAALIRRALHAPAKLELWSGDKGMSDATRQLVKEIVMAEMATLKVPSWRLVDDVHSGALFEALRKKFPNGKAEGYDYTSACEWYLEGLIGQGRTDDAVKFAASVGTSAPEDDERILSYSMAGRLEETHPEELWKFLRVWLATAPGSDQWTRFNRLSAQLDHREELKALIKTLAGSGAFNGLDRLTVQRMQVDAEMATGDLSGAASRMRGMIQPPAVTAKERSLQFRAAQRLLALTHLQGDAPGYTSALAAAEALLEGIHADNPETALSDAQSLISDLNGMGRYADGLHIGRKALAWATAHKLAAETKNDPERSRFSGGSDESEGILGELLRAEVELGHWPEARALLTDSQGWGTPDIAGLLDRALSCRGKTVGYYAARTVQSGGNLSLTRRILEQQLVATPAADAVYEAYLKVAGAEAMPLLERLAASDRYEERPLIWKARLQMDAKQWDAAIVTLQQAITIDPSDGEQGHGDRMRVYAFMSEAKAAKGDAEKSAFFANVVKAIRLSETADDWYEIGAYARAIELYRDALNFFQDAYCIQSRLAIRLADAGKMDEAVEHYRHAFELMPDSFGRVESHCFGCEHVFAGKQTQGVADEVFARMLKARPDNPQLYYLTGYLREEQKRLPEAADLYRHAVQLDPLYLNAWKRLADLDESLNFTPAQRDDLLLKLLTLDPSQEHASPELERVSDLPRLWKVLKDNSDLLNALPKRTPLSELKASAAALARESRTEASWKYEQEKRGFVAVVLAHPFMRNLGSYLASLNAPAVPQGGEPVTAPDAPRPAEPKAKP